VVREQRRNGPPIVGPVILIGAGVLFLLNNLGIVDWGIWQSLWRLWPIVLIAIGLDLLIGRRNPLVSLAIVVLVIGAGAAVLVTTGGIRGAGNIESSGLSVPLASAKAADVDIDFGMGNLTVDGNGESGQLAVGTLEFWQNLGAPRQDVDASGDTVQLRLAQRPNIGFPWFGETGQGVDWTIHLSPDVPVDLKADLGAGNAELDLSRLQLSDLEVKAGAGNTTVTFPENAGDLSANIDGGVGNITLHVPDGVEARIKIDSGVGNVAVDSRFSKDGDRYVTSGYNNSSPGERVDIDLKMGVGDVKVQR
jgi:hypothetical protein